MENARFGDDVDGWESFSGSEFVHDPEVGEFTPGSARMRSGSNEQGAVKQCVRLSERGADGGGTYRISIAAMGSVAAPPASTVGVATSVAAYSNSDCSGTEAYLGGRGSSVTVGEWGRVNYDLRIPQGMSSVELSGIVTTVAEGHELWLDDFSVVRRGIFLDGFESGDTSAWSLTVP